MEFVGSKVTSDAEFLACPEVAGKPRQDSRNGKDGWHGVTGRFLPMVYGRLGDHEDVNDDDYLARDSAMRWIVGGRAVENPAASTSQMGRLVLTLSPT